LVEWIALIGGPIAVNLVLAFVLTTALPPGIEDPDAPPPTLTQDVVERLPRLPRPELRQILAEVTRLAGHEYRCEGPWITDNGLRNWACRTPDALAIIRGPTPDIISRIEITWFGFDTRSTDLPSWASAASQHDSATAGMAASWVLAGVGSESTTSIGDLGLETGGGRGSYTLILVGHVVPDR
jgi:hypothetical protein